MNNCIVLFLGLELANIISNGVNLVLVCIVLLASSIVLTAQSQEKKKGGTTVATSNMTYCN